MAFSKCKSEVREQSDKSAYQARVRAEARELLKQWRKVDLIKQRIVNSLPDWDLLDRWPTFMLRRVSLLQIYLKFMTADMVTTIAANTNPQRLLYNGDSVVLFPATIRADTGAL